MDLELIQEAKVVPNSFMHDIVNKLQNMKNNE